MAFFSLDQLGKEHIMVWWCKWRVELIEIWVLVVFLVTSFTICVTTQCYYFWSPALLPCAAGYCAHCSLCVT